MFEHEKVQKNLYEAELRLDKSPMSDYVCNRLQFFVGLYYV